MDRTGVRKKAVGRPKGMTLDQEQKERVGAGQRARWQELRDLLEFMHDFRDRMLPEMMRLTARNEILEAELKRRMERELRGTGH
jgi:hypothetical protein